MAPALGVRFGTLVGHINSYKKFPSVTICGSEGLGGGLVLFRLFVGYFYVVMLGWVVLLFVW